MSFHKKIALTILTSLVVIPIIIIMYIYIQFTSHIKTQYPSKSFFVKLPLYSISTKSFSSKAICLDNDINFTISKVSTNISDNYQKNLTTITLEKELEKYLKECNITLFNITSITSIEDYIIDASPEENLKKLPKDITISLTRKSNTNEVSNNIYLFYNKILNPNGISIDSLKLNGEINGISRNISLNNSYSSLSLDAIKYNISNQVK